MGAIAHMLRHGGLRSASPHAVVFADRDQAFSVEVDGRLDEQRMVDLLGRRPKACDTYRLLLADRNLVPQLRRAARRGLRRPFTKGALPPSFAYYMFGPMVFDLQPLAQHY